MTLSDEELTSVSESRRSATVSSIPPSIPPPGDDDSPELLAALVLSRNRGIAPSPGSIQIGVARAVRTVSRVFAPPAGAMLGVWTGTLFAPLWLLFPMPWFKRIGFAVLSPVRGLALGTVLGCRYFV